MSHQPYPNLTLQSQSAFSALSASDIMAHLNITDSGQSAYVQTLLDAAVGYCERYTQLDLRTTTWLLTLDRFPCWYAQGFNYGWGTFAGASQWAYPQSAIISYQAISTLRGPLQSITSIEYYDQTNTIQTVASNTYTFSLPSYFPSIIEPTTVWPVAFARPDAVQITFVSGMATPPANLLHAIKLLCGQWYAERENISYGPNTASGATGLAVESLLNQFTTTAVG